jgi:hypothetical protein
MEHQVSSLRYVLLNLRCIFGFSFRCVMILIVVFVEAICDEGKAELLYHFSVFTCWDNGCLLFLQYITCYYIVKMQYINLNLCYCSRYYLRLSKMKCFNSKKCKTGWCDIDEFICECKADNLQWVEQTEFASCCILQKSSSWTCLVFDINEYDIKMQRVAVMKKWGDVSTIYWVSPFWRKFVWKKRTS